jgi:TonB family protein
MLSKLVSGRRNRWVARAVLALGIALGAHAVVLSLLSFGLAELGQSLPPGASAAASSAAAPPVDDERPMEIETLVNQLERPEEKTEEEKRKEEEAKKEAEDKNPHGQVVDIARPAIEERPDKSNFVSEYDTKVERETKGPNARDHAGDKQEREGGKEALIFPPPSPGSTASAPKLPEGRPDARPGKPGPLALRESQPRPTGKPGSEAEQPPERDGELVRPGQSGARTPPPQQQTGEGGSEGTPGGPPSDGKAGDRRPNLQATPEMLQRAIAKGNGSMDYLKDVDDGESTALNSKKWAHAPFFNRVKRSVADEWHPEVVYVRHDPNGNVYGVKDRVTLLRIHLRPDGKLAAWTVLQSSGVDFLDDEAIDAFRKAQPFPNPPKALVESDGQIHFNFAFIFELSGRTSVKVYKYQ